MNNQTESYDQIDHIVEEQIERENIDGEYQRSIETGLVDQ